MSVESNVTSTPETLPQNYSVLLLTFIDNKSVKTTKAPSYPPDSSPNFDYMVKFLADKFFVPQSLLDKALPTKPDFFEKWLIEKLGEKIQVYPYLLTNFSYGWGLGNPNKPYEILLSFSNEYIEDFGSQIVHFVPPDQPFHTSDLKEAKQRIASLLEHWKKDGYFSNVDLAWTNYVPQHIVNWVFETSSSSPRSSPKLCLKNDAFYAQNPFDWLGHLARMSLYSHYIALFSDIVKDGIVKQCPICHKLFSRPKSEKRWFDPKVYCSPRCRRRPGNQRYYKKHQGELRPKHREYMRDYRKTCKKPKMSYDKDVSGRIKTP